MTLASSAAPSLNPSPDLSALPARERILTAAHSLFYREGLRATGVDRVIATAGVSKVTFYRHFPSKDDLIRAFLQYRHERWMAWFQAALARHQAEQAEPARERQPLQPVALALSEWLRDPGFRGCAFINAVAELGGGLAEALPMAAAHKQDMVDAIAALLPGWSEAEAQSMAAAAGLAVDGAIVRAQTGGAAVEAAVQALTRVLAALDALPPPKPMTP